MPETDNDTVDPKLVQALKREKRTNQFRFGGALLFGILMGLLGLPILLGSLFQSSAGGVVIGLVLTAVSAYLLYSARDHSTNL